VHRRVLILKKESASGIRGRRFVQHMEHAVVWESGQITTKKHSNQPGDTTQVEVVDVSDEASGNKTNSETIT